MDDSTESENTSILEVSLSNKTDEEEEVSTEEESVVRSRQIAISHGGPVQQILDLE